MSDREIKVEFTTSVPSSVTDEGVQEWLEFELGANGSMPMMNSLAGESLEADAFSVTFD